MRPALVLLLVLLGGCRDLYEPPGAQGLDASIGDAAADGAPPAAGLVPAIGRAASVDVICWNVRQFPATAATPKALADLLDSLAVDVAAIMEIDEDDAFDELLGHLPGWRGYLGGGDGYIKLALLWRPAEVNVTGVSRIFDFDADFPRPAIVATLSRGADELTLIAVHLKAGRTDADALRRRNANTKLAGWLGARGNPAALLCGDFNEDMDNPAASEVYGAYLASPHIFRMLTAPLDRAGATTYLPSRVMLDHMISTAAMDGMLGSELPFIPPLDRQFPGYLMSISDHLPVALRLDLRR
jgi:hypothetical protein